LLCLNTFASFKYFIGLVEDLLVNGIEFSIDTLDDKVSFGITWLEAL
jgi:hypothetical protein